MKDLRRRLSAPATAGLVGLSGCRLGEQARVGWWRWQMAGLHWARRVDVVHRHSPHGAGAPLILVSGTEHHLPQRPASCNMKQAAISGISGAAHHDASTFALPAGKTAIAETDGTPMRPIWRAE
jgi:hypothetical protein